MQTPNAALVARHVAAFNAADVDALLADFTADATWVTGTYAVPPGQLRDFFRDAMQELTPRLTVHRSIDGGDAVAVEMTESWTVGDRPDSKALVAVFSLREGKIAAAKIYREGSADVARPNVGRPAE
jgi:ketosteroid isomerase-like protein